MKKLLSLVYLLLPALLFAQQRTPEQDSLIAQTQRKTKADHADMLQQLGISALRPGRSGNPTGSNPANYDDSKFARHFDNE
jgi:hypothetical protein